MTMEDPENSESSASSRKIESGVMPHAFDFIVEREEQQDLQR